MKNDMPKKYQRWEILRKKGRLKFILMNGVLGLGGFMWAVMNLPDFFEGRFVSVNYVIVTIFVALGTGGLWGFIVWSTAENNYQKYLKKILNET